jgi:hypothetical protein
VFHKLAVFGDHFPKGLGLNISRNLGFILADPVWSEIEDIIFESNRVLVFEILFEIMPVVRLMILRPIKVMAARSPARWSGDWGVVVVSAGGVEGRGSE